MKHSRFRAESFRALLPARATTDINRIPLEADLQRAQYVLISIFLQPSPVRQNDQLKRLYNIDNGWAASSSWQDESSRSFHSSAVRVFAAISPEYLNGAESSMLSSFKNIYSIRLQPYEKPAKATDLPTNAFSNLINVFLSFCIHNRSQSSKWLVYANDHSFFIPANLNRYLQSLDAEHLVYTGNRLAIHLGNKVLSFASGGAGAVLSHGCVKLMLLLWSALGTQEFYKALLFVAGQNMFLVDETVLNWDNIVMGDVLRPNDGAEECDNFANGYNSTLYEDAFRFDWHREQSSAVSVFCLFVFISHWARNSQPQRQYKEVGYVWVQHIDMRTKYDTCVDGVA